MRPEIHLEGAVKDLPPVKIYICGKCKGEFQASAYSSLGSFWNHFENCKVVMSTLEDIREK